MRSVLLLACVISAAPLAALLALVLAGYAAAVPALLAVAAIAAAGWSLALVWARDLGRVAMILRAAALGMPGGVAPHFPLLALAAREGQRVVRDLLRRVERAEALRRSDAAIVETLAEPLLILGADLRLRRANQAAVRQFGPDAAAILRHPVLRGALDRMMDTGTPQTVELSLPVPVPRELRATVSCLDGEPEGDQVVVLLADRTQERALERMRADFVANAGHELRTPLASLTGFIETLRGPAADDPSAQQRFLTIMSEQADRMERLITDLLSLSRIEMTERQPPTGDVDLARLAERVAAEFEPAIRARKASLVLALHPALGPVTGDADQLAQVLHNLLDNALKYGGEGVRIRLVTEPAPPDERWPGQPGAILCVEDNGPGIAREHLPRLTERFYRVDAGRSRAAGGTGLGLAIVKHIVQRHRGRLDIESTEGMGSTFSVWLPAGAGLSFPAAQSASAGPFGTEAG